MLSIVKSFFVRFDSFTNNGVLLMCSNAVDSTISSTICLCLFVRPARFLQIVSFEIVALVDVLSVCCTVCIFVLFATLVAF